MKSTIATIALFAANARACHKIFWDDARDVGNNLIVENSGYTAWNKIGEPYEYDFEVALGLEL